MTKHGHSVRSRSNFVLMFSEVRMSLTPVVAAPCEIPECLYGYPVIHLIRKRATEVAWQRFASYFKPLEKRRGFNRQTMDTHSTSTKRSSQNVSHMHYPVVHGRKRGNTMTYSQQGEMTAESPLGLSFSKGRSEDALERHLCVTCGRKYASQSRLRIHQKLCYLDHVVQQAASSSSNAASFVGDTITHLPLLLPPVLQFSRGVETPMLKGHQASVTRLCKSENFKEESGDNFSGAAETHDLKAALEADYHGLKKEIFPSDDQKGFSDGTERKVFTGFLQSNKSYTRADEKGASVSASKLGLKQQSYTSHPIQSLFQRYGAASMPMADTKAKSTTYKQADEKQMFQQDPLLRQTRNPSLIPPSGCLRRSHSSVHELSWEKLETRVAEKKEDASLSRELDNEGQPAASPDLSDSDPSVPQPVFGDKWEACEEFGSDGGLLHCDDSDVVLEIPENSIKASQQISIRAAVSTDLQTIHKRLELSEDEMIMSPVPEFDAGDNFEFEKPVVVILPHFIPTVDRPDMLNVYKFHLYDSEILHFEKLRQAPVHESITKQEAHCGVFVLSAPQTIHIVTSHFTGFFCTLCNKQVVPRPLRLRLYGRHIQRDTQDVDIWLFVGDTRLDIRDFRKAVLPREEDEAYFITTQSTEPLPDDSMDVKLGVRLVISGSERAMWQHREIGGRVLPSERKVNVKQFRPCNSCSEPCPQNITWSLINKPGNFPKRWFNSFIEAGFCRPDGAALQFLEELGQNTLGIIGLELRDEKTLEVNMSEKSPMIELASTPPPASQTNPRLATEFPPAIQRKTSSGRERATTSNQTPDDRQAVSTSYATTTTRSASDENALPDSETLEAEEYNQTHPPDDVSAMGTENNCEQSEGNNLRPPAFISSTAGDHSVEPLDMTVGGSCFQDPSTSDSSLVDIFISKARREGSGWQGPSVYNFHAHINKFYHTNNSSVTMPTNKAQTVTFNVSSNPPDRKEGGDDQTERKSDTALPVSVDPVGNGSTPCLPSQQDQHETALQNSNTGAPALSVKPTTHRQSSNSSAVERYANQEGCSNPSTSKEGQGADKASGSTTTVFKLSSGKLQTMKDHEVHLNRETAGYGSPSYTEIHRYRWKSELPSCSTRSEGPLVTTAGKTTARNGHSTGSPQNTPDQLHSSISVAILEKIFEDLTAAPKEEVVGGDVTMSTNQVQHGLDTNKMPEVRGAVSQNASVLPPSPGDQKSRLTRKSSRNGLNSILWESPSPPQNDHTEGDLSTSVLGASQKLRGRKTRGKDGTLVTKEQESQDHTRSTRSRGNGAPVISGKRKNALVLTNGKRPRMANV